MAVALGLRSSVLVASGFESLVPYHQAVVKCLTRQIANLLIVG